MQFSKIALTSALLAIAGAQGTTDGGLSISIPDIASITSELGAQGTNIASAVSNALSGITNFSIPPQYSSLVASYSSVIAAAGTNTASLAAIQSQIMSQIENGGQMPTAGSNTASAGGASGGGSSGSSNGGSSGNGQSSSSSGGAAAPTAVKAGGALAAAGLAVVAFL